MEKSILDTNQKTAIENARFAARYRATREGEYVGIWYEEMEERYYIRPEAEPEWPSPLPASAVKIEVWDSKGRKVYHLPR